jgi:tetratricopeptide (TPR) repeat protein
MSRMSLIAVLALLVSACAPTIQERVQQYNDLGLQHYQKAEYERACEDFQAALALRPNDFALLYNMARCYDLLGQSNKAEPIYRQCLLLQPNDAKCRHALDALLIQHGRLVEAQRMVQDWLTREPQLAAAYAEDGWLYEQENHPIEAIKRYQQAIGYDPRNGQALIGMGRVYEEEMNLPSRALKLYQTALDYQPDQPDLVKRVSRLRARGVGPPHPDS